MKNICKRFCTSAVIVSTVLFTACGQTQASHMDMPDTSEYHGDAVIAQDVDEAAYNLDDALSDEDMERETKYMKYLEITLASDILDAYSSVKSANVALFGDMNEMQANICLEVQDDFTKDNAAEVAKVVAIAIGDEEQENINIKDTEGNVLFPGK